MEDAQLLRRFEDRSLPFGEWTHRAHVKVSFLYLREHGFDEALRRLRERIKAFNAHHKVPENATSGYNETTTQAFLHLIAATMAAYGELFPVATADEFCDAHPQLMTKFALRFFYSPKQRMKPEAKARFVEPDRTALPKIEN